MFSVELTCSDLECDFLVEEVGDLDELEALACECGCTLQVLSVSEVEVVGLPAPVHTLRPRRRPSAALAA